MNHRHRHAAKGPIEATFVTITPFASVLPIVLACVCVCGNSEQKEVPGARYQGLPRSRVQSKNKPSHAPMLLFLLGIVVHGLFLIIVRFFFYTCVILRE
jgi:hypothetical protein